MLSYEKCCELRDAGFPQPKPAVGQVWWVDVTFHPDFPAPHRQVVVSVDGSDKPFVTNRILGTDGLMFGTLYRVYCPTVEDMLSMLKSDYVLRKIEERKWAIVLVPGKGALYLEKTPLETLFEAFVDRRYLFEGYSLTGGRQGSGA